MMRIGLKTLVVLGAAIMILSGLLPGVEAVRTGAAGNEPSDGYVNGEDRIIIYHQDGSADTSFDIGETVYVNITSSRLPSVPSVSRLEVLDRFGNQIVSQLPAFTLNSTWGSYKSFHGSITLDPGLFTEPDHYLLYAYIKGTGSTKFEAMDTIIVGGGNTSAMKYIKCFADSGFSTESYTFQSTDTIYIEAYAGEQLDLGASAIEMVDFTTKNSAVVAMDSMSTDPVMNGDYIRITYSIQDEAVSNGLNLVEGNWYMIKVNLVNTTGAGILTDWTALVYITQSLAPSITGISVSPASVDAGTNEKLNFTLSFTDSDNTLTEFKVTLKVRAPDDTTIITLLDNGIPGTDLNGSDLGGGSFEVYYLWDPPQHIQSGFYDVYAMVSDPSGAFSVSGFPKNTDVFELTNTTINPPVITGVYCSPSKVLVDGTNGTTIGANFTDVDNHAPDTFKVSIKVRDSSGQEIVLASSLKDGDTGATGSVLSVTGSSGSYTLSYLWVPDSSTPLGPYDVDVVVIDADMQKDESTYADNADVLYLMASVNPPIITNITVTPSSVDRVGNATATFSVEFTDADAHPATAFNATLKLGANEIVLVDNVTSGSPAAAGGTVYITSTGPSYLLTYEWDPAIDVPTGKYDLFVSIYDPDGLSAVSDYADNQRIIEVISSDNPPVITQVSVFPNTVDKVGTATVAFQLAFTDDDQPPQSPDNYTISISIRAPDNSEYAIVDSAQNGNGITLSYASGTYTLQYMWDPPTSVPSGTYDVAVSVSDLKGYVTTSGYGENQDILTITSSKKEPVINQVLAVPSVVNMIGAGTTTISVEFSDEDTTGVNNFTVTLKVRGPDGNITTILNASGDGDGVTIQDSGTGVYTAIYSWNPADNMLPGKYDVRAEVTDEVGLVGYSDFSDNKGLVELVLPAGGVPPSIKSVNVVPYNVSVDKGVTVNITCEFSDPDGHDSSSFTVTIILRDSAGINHTLVDNTSAGSTTPGGGTLQVTKPGADYLMTYSWIPPADSYNGKYDLYIKVMDPTGLYDESGFDENSGVLNVLNGSSTPVVEGHAPVLDGSVAREGEFYNFTAVFTDADGDLPADGVTLVLDGEEYAMKEVDSSDNDTTDGKEYYFKIKLSDEKHTFSFKASDGTNEAIGNGTEPQTLDLTPETSSGSTSTWMYLIILLIVIGVVMAAIYLIGGRKEEAEDTEKPKEEVDTETQEEENSEVEWEEGGEDTEDTEEKDVEKGSEEPEEDVETDEDKEE